MSLNTNFIQHLLRKNSNVFFTVFCSDELDSTIHRVSLENITRHEIECNIFKDNGQRPYQTRRYKITSLFSFLFSNFTRTKSSVIFSKLKEKYFHSFFQMKEP